MQNIDSLNVESNVRSYCRDFPAVFKTAFGSKIIDNEGNEYIDFLSGCGSLNYGHNHPLLIEPLIEHISSNGLTMSLDMMSESKIEFMSSFDTHILQPKKLKYLFQFTGPTGTNAVEAAIKVARKATGRTNVIAFTNAFHGCSLGSLSLTGSSHHRSTSTPLLNGVFRCPYEGYLGDHLDTAAYLQSMIDDPSSGCDLPAAIILETVQGEGGLQVASSEWAMKIEAIARKNNIIVIVDDIQAGCGRCGTFFSFEHLGISPDIICMAKSLSGLGLPMSMILLKPSLDCWAPGEHNGTFRGNNYAFVTATNAINSFWQTQEFSEAVQSKTKLLRTIIGEEISKYGLGFKGRGLMLGIEFSSAEQANAVQQHCFKNGLILETCGPLGSVIKLLPALTIDNPHLNEGARILCSGIASAMERVIVETVIPQAKAYAS